MSRTVKREIQNSKNELHISPISIWEARLLASRGKLKTKPNFSVWLEQTLFQRPLREAPLNFAVATEAAGLSLPQSDLGDVFLAATASVFGLTLVTADDQLLSCEWLKTMPNE